MDAKTKARLISAARRISRFHAPRNEAKKKLKVDKALYRCEECKDLIYEGKSTRTFYAYVEKYAPETVRMIRYDMDHKNTVVALDSISHDWNIYFDRLFCDEENFRGLCSEPCHSKKTSSERKTRLANKYGNRKPKETK